MKSIKNLVCLLFAFMPLLSFSQVPEKTFTEQLDGIETTSTELTQNASTDNSSIGQAGAMSTSVPLITVSSRTMQFPLQLQYSAGIKVDQQSGPVGLGWAMPVGSIVRDYGAFEPDYTSTTFEADMENVNPVGQGINFDGYLNPSNLAMDPKKHNELLIYDVISADHDRREIPLSDFYRMNVAGFGANSFWNGGNVTEETEEPHQWLWTERETWDIEHTVKTYRIQQEFSSINEANMGLPYHTNKNNFDFTGSYAAAIGVLPYVKNASVGNPSSYLFLGNEAWVEYEDFESFTVTSGDGTKYIFGRALRGQKFVFSDNPYWSVQPNNDGTGEIANGDFWKIDYVAEWLLTEIRSVDYEDLNNNGVADDGDAGDWIRFEYTESTKFETSEVTPLSEVPMHREWSNFSQTDRASSLMRERAYLTKIITPVQELDFTISERFDVNHDYFTKPANQLTGGNDYYYENRQYGTQGSATDFDIFYPVETMKYDSIYVKSKMIDENLYTNENLITGAIVLDYADQGSSEQLAVSEYLIRDNANVQHPLADNPSTGGSFDIEDYTDGTADKRGKTTLLAVHMLGGDLNSADRTSYEFEYAFNPSFDEFHKRDIVRKYAFPSLRTGSGIAHSIGSIAYNEFEFNALGTVGNTAVHSVIIPDDFKIDFPYEEVLYKMDYSATSHSDYISNGYTGLEGNQLLAFPITHPIKPIKDVFGFMYAQNCSICPEAWSLTGITYPTGGEVSFEYEQATFLKSTDETNWNISENQFPIITDYNEFAKKRSYVQDAYNQHAIIEGVGIGVNNLQKELTATFEVEMPSNYGIRLKSKQINDQINPIVTIDYTYSNGHFTSAPAEYVQSYTGAYNAFIQRENQRHSWEYDNYGPNTSYTDFKDRMRHASITGFSLDEYQAIFFYETIDESYSDNSFSRSHYGPLHGNTAVDYDAFEVFCYRHPGGTYSGRYILARLNFNLDPVTLLKQELFQAGASTAYQSTTFEYERVKFVSYDLNFDYSLNTNDPNTINMWGLINSYPVYVPYTQEFFTSFTNIGGVNVASFGLNGTGTNGLGWVDGISVVGDLQLPYNGSTATNYERWGTFKTTLKSTTTTYKGLSTTIEYTYDPIHRLVEEKTFTPNTSEVYYTTYKYADDTYSVLTSAFLDLNMFNVQTEVNTYLGSVSNATALSAQVITYDYTSFSVPRPLDAYQFETDVLNIDGTFTLVDYIVGGSNSDWRITESDIYEYNYEGAPFSLRTNRLFNKTVFGSNNNIPKASIAFPEHSFDATYSGFEDFHGRHNIVNWDAERYKDEDWFSQEIELANEPAYSAHSFNNPCGVDLPNWAYTYVNMTRLLNVVTVDNISGIKVGDVVEVELLGSNLAVPGGTAYQWSIETTVSEILTTDDYVFYGSAGPYVLDYILCFNDPLEYPTSNLIVGPDTNELAWNTISQTNVTLKNPTYHLSDLFARTGKYSYKLRTQRDEADPFHKTPLRPVKVEQWSVQNCTNPVWPANKECFWNYEASIWLKYDRDLDRAMPSSQAPVQSADPAGDAIYRRGGVATVDNGSGIKIICDVWNGYRTVLLEQKVFYVEDINANWQQFTVNVPIEKGAEKWLDVYVQNEIEQHGAINTNESMALFADDIVIYPKDAKYTYSTIDKFGNTTFQTNNNDVYVESVYDAKGRAISQNNQYGTLVSSMEYFEHPNWNYQTNTVTQRSWIDNGVYNSTRYYLDGLGKTKQVMVSDVERGARTVTETNTFDGKGLVVRSYKPYILNGANFLPNFDDDFDVNTQNLYGSNNAFTEATYFPVPEQKMASIIAPRLDTESPITSTQSDYVSTTNITYPFLTSVPTYQAGTMLVHKTIDAMGAHTWTYMDNLGRVILEEHEIGNEHVQNPNGSITHTAVAIPNAKTWFVYDGAGRITQVVDPEGKSTQYIYNSLGVVIKKISPDKGISEMRYDQYGQVRFVRGAKDVIAVSNNAYGTDQFSYLKYDAWGRTIEGGFVQAAIVDPAIIPHTPHIYFDDYTYINDQEFPLATDPFVELHQELEYDGTRILWSSEALLSTTVYSDHYLNPASGYSYDAAATDVTSVSYMADDQPAEILYDMDGLAGTHKFTPIYNGMRMNTGKRYIHPSNNLYDFIWTSELDNFGRVETASTSHGAISTQHGQYYYDLLGNLLMKGIAETGIPADPHLDYYAYKNDIRDQLEHHVSKNFRFGLQHNENGNITSQYWSNEHYDPTTGSSININQYAYFYDEMSRLIGADYRQATEAVNPFTYYSTLASGLPNDFNCGTLEFALMIVLDPIIDELNDNITNRVLEDLSTRSLNAINLLKAEYLDNDVAFQTMTVAERDAFLANYISELDIARINSNSYEEYQATQLEDEEHLDLISEGALAPEDMKYTILLLNSISFDPYVQCNANASATVYGFLPTFPYPTTVTNVTPYDAAYWYSENGNLTDLNRNDELGVKTEQEYTYSVATSNQLSSVDWSQGPTTIASHSYSYDPSGNLLDDSRNGVTNIDYISYNDMPQSITNGSGTTEYRYNEQQQRSVKIHPTESEYYMEGIVMDQNGVVKSYQTSEGFAAMSGGNLNYYYNIKDWLGTNRGVMDANGDIENVTDHYPFGMRMPARWLVAEQEGRRYQFTGHEFDEETNYGYHGARYYNRELGRYMSVDRFSENFYGQSPYVYAGNRVIDAVDVNGDSIIINDEGYIISAERDSDGILIDNLVFMQGGDGSLTSLGELTREVNADDWFANLLAGNAQESADLTLLGMFTFQSYEAGNGKWDFKNLNRGNELLNQGGRAPHILGLAFELDHDDTEFSFNGEIYRSEDLNNFHFGVTANAIGFPEETALRRAGIAEMGKWSREGNGEVPESWRPVQTIITSGGSGSMIMAPYGDNPIDHEMIKRGMSFYNNNEAQLLRRSGGW
ncbi:MAG: RHS repeat-associated core domain-containing protein [Crocinitomicaceae bacterium]|nr:RHS repeat-associated core domain-containing protein [Crocinitomicaceae bacterium]